MWVDDEVLRLLGAEGASSLGEVLRAARAKGVPPSLLEGGRQSLEEYLRRMEKGEREVGLEEVLEALRRCAQAHPEARTELYGAFLLALGSGQEGVRVPLGEAEAWAGAPE